jgi:hypothetical protein
VHALQDKTGVGVLLDKTGMGALHDKTGVRTLRDKTREGALCDKTGRAQPVGTRIYNYVALLAHGPEIKENSFWKPPSKAPIFVSISHSFRHGIFPKDFSRGVGSTHRPSSVFGSKINCRSMTPKRMVEA